MQEEKISRKIVKDFIMKKKSLNVQSTLLCDLQLSLSFGLFYNSGR